jgi:hypothetical protein
MFKKIFLHALLAGVLASLAGIIYNRIYYFATEVDFSHALNRGKIIGFSVLISMFAALFNYFLNRLLKKKGEIVFNLLFSLLSFAAVMVPISISLPLDVKSPELFPGLAVPMVFFPAIAWYTLNPLFTSYSSSVQLPHDLPPLQ